MGNAQACTISYLTSSEPVDEKHHYPAATKECWLHCWEECWLHCWLQDELMATKSWDYCCPLK